MGLHVYLLKGNFLHSITPLNLNPKTPTLKPLDCIHIHLDVHMNPHISFQLSVVMGERISNFELGYPNSPPP